MEFKDYEQLGKLLKEAEKIMYAHEWQTPKKAPINKHFEKALKHVSEAKNHLEEMMFIEYPNQATTHIFYGKDTSTT